MAQMESVRLKIHGHMTSVGEEMLFVLEKYTSDVCSVKLDVRVFVLERLSEVAELLCNLFQKEMETLHNTKLYNADHHRERSIESRETASRRYSTFSEEQREMDQGCGLLDARLKPVVKLYRLNVHNLPVGEDQVSPEQQEQPEPPQNEEEHEEVLQRSEENEGLTLLTLPTVESEDDDENGETEPVAGTSSTEHMKTQADVQDRGTSQPTSDEHLSSAESEDEDWKPALNTLKSQKTKHVKGQRSLSNKLSKDQKSLKQTDSVTSSKGCSQKRSRKRPVKTRTRGTPLTCEVCGKLQSSISNLNTHMRIHTGEKPYTCTVCCKAFRTLNNFQLHMRNHTGEKPFTCATCGKSFSHQSHLKKHLYVHTGEKPYTCEVCHEAYSHLWYLKYHMRTHTGDKPFTCSVCCKDFSQSHHLKDHMRLHTGEKPFACLVCGHKFNHKNHLKLHMRIHTGEKPFTCTLCARQFARNDKLRNHLRTHKGEKNKTPEDS